MLDFQIYEAGCFFGSSHDVALRLLFESIVRDPSCHIMQDEVGSLKVGTPGAGWGGPDIHRLRDLYTSSLEYH
jgi:hypothetical protein